MGELHSQNLKAAEAKLFEALKNCPCSGILWSQSIAMASKPQLKSRCIDAIKYCENDPYVICAIAQLFWYGHKIKKARHWFMRALGLSPDIGDLWSIYYRFESHHGTPEQKENLVSKCKAANPHIGEIW